MEVADAVMGRVTMGAAARAWALVCRVMIPKMNAEVVTRAIAFVAILIDFSEMYSIITFVLCILCP